MGTLFLWWAGVAAWILLLYEVLYDAGMTSVVRVQGGTGGAGHLVVDG